MISPRYSKHYNPNPMLRYIYIQYIYMYNIYIYTVPNDIPTKSPIQPMIAGISSHAWKQSGLCRVHPATKWHVSSKQNLKKLPENDHCASSRGHKGIVYYIAVKQVPKQNSAFIAFIA